MLRAAYDVAAIERHIQRNDHGERTHHRQATACDPCELISRYQENPYVHPLTCGTNSSHNTLVPTATKAGIVLLCPDCDYTQLMYDDLIDICLSAWNMPSPFAELFGKPEETDRFVLSARLERLAGRLAGIVPSEPLLLPEDLDTIRSAASELTTRDPFFFCTNVKDNDSVEHIMPSEADALAWLQYRHYQAFREDEMAGPADIAEVRSSDGNLLSAEMTTRDGAVCRIKAMPRVDMRDLRRA